ncbi:MAG: alpha/beta fold hydrolase [Haloarculaceae archaeon]
MTATGEHTVDHDGRETAYRTVAGAAAGPTTLYVHGSGGDRRLWSYQYAPRGPAHPAVALDLSGHGASDDVDLPAGPETLAAYVADVRAVARATGASVFVGNSLGGAVLLRSVLDGALDPSAVVLAGTGAKLAVHEQLRDALADDFGAALDLLHGPDRLFHDADETLVGRSRAAMAETGRAVTERDFLTCHAFDVRGELDTVPCSALALVGEHDTLTPVAYHEYLAERLPDCRLSVIDDAAHLAMLERPGAFNDTVAAFLGSVQ